MPSGGATPALLEAAYEAKQQSQELLLVELPMLQYAGEGPPSTTRPVVARTGDFLFRLLTFSEFDTFSKLAQFGDVAELVLKATMVYPKIGTWEEHPIQSVETGAYEEVAALVIDTSGFESKQQMVSNLNMGRQLSNTIYGAAQMFICKAFPGLDPRDLGRMPMPEMFRYLAMSEQMLAQEGRPTEFPLREFFGSKTRQKKGPFDVPTIDQFSKLPTLTDAQINRLKAGDRAAAVKRAVQERRELSKNPEARANRSAEIRRRKMDQIAESRRRDEMRASQSMSDEIASEFGS